MRQNGVRSNVRFMKSGGRAMKAGGGSMSTARKDMKSGYYQDDMGMRGGAMYKKGGKVGKKKQGYKARKDESIAMRIKKKRYDVWLLQRRYGYEGWCYV